MANGPRAYYISLMGTPRRHGYAKITKSSIHSRELVDNAMERWGGTWSLLIDHLLTEYVAGRADGKQVQETSCTKEIFA